MIDFDDKNLYGKYRFPGSLVRGIFVYRLNMTCTFYEEFTFLFK